MFSFQKQPIRRAIRAALASIFLVIPPPHNDLAAAETTFVAPYYFGPNAFPIPELTDTTQSKLLIEVAGNYFSGRRDDHTTDLTLKTVIPLFTDRANLSIWLPVIEWYRNGPLYLESCNIAPPYTQKDKRGSLTGDVYVTTDIQIFREKRLLPDVFVRAGLKTASGGGSEQARYYDCPGYFFDVAVGKTFIISDPLELSLRAAATTGFLCWQTGKSKQNDAVMFGVRLALNFKRFTLSETFGGYSGWEHMASTQKHRAHDLPMSLRTSLKWHPGSRWRFTVAFEYGFTDYPYNHFAISTAYLIPILKR